MKDPNSCIAKRLKQVRLAAGISQKKLGVLSGIHEHSASARMNQYEVGAYIPNFLTLQQIGKALGYPVAFFFSDDDLMAELAYWAHQLSEADKLKVLNVIKELALRYRETSNESTC